MTKRELSLVMRISAMVLLSIACMITSTLILRPSADSVTKLLLSLPGYSQTEEVSPSLSYSALNPEDISDMRIFRATDLTSHEFAVIKLSRTADANDVISKLRSRADEIITQFEDNPSELLRAKYFRITYIDDFVILTVYDTNSTAENAVHAYFAEQP